MLKLLLTLHHNFYENIQNVLQIFVGAGFILKYFVPVGWAFERKI